MIEERLREMGIELPLASKALGSYVPWLKTDKLLFLSGLLPMINGQLRYQGRVGEDVSLEQAMDAARIITINALSILKDSLGSLDKIRQCVKLSGYVSSAEGFTEQPRVLNAASDLLVGIFGNRGRHVRVAVGVSVLPLNSPLEIDFIFEVEE